ncbi:hypothetical protein CMALT394_970002 [Carnobacterium maltaromaticum]|nr:hypothetical protein CMALT394_970002 [Carnobacterium maltaromaticum]
MPTTKAEILRDYHWSTNSNMYVNNKTGIPSPEVTGLYNMFVQAEHTSQKNPQLEFFNEMLRTGKHPTTGVKITEAERANAVLMLYTLALQPFVGAWAMSKIPQSAGKAPEIKNTGKANNVADYQKYKIQLRKEDIVENSKSIISGDRLKDPIVISELTKDGSSMSDWAKMESTYSYETSMGNGKVHYYKNTKTGEINFYDAKMKVPIPKDLKIRNNLTDDFWIIDLDSEFIPKGVR